MAFSSCFLLSAMLIFMGPPERFELPTPGFEDQYSSTELKGQKTKYTTMRSIRHYINILEDTGVLDRERVIQKQEVPLHVPGGATVVVLNDHVTPFEVAVEAVAASTGLSESEASTRMMKAHKQGWAAVAAYANKDIAESVAYKIMRHARGNTNYDHYRRFVKHIGPWPLTAEVMDAEQ